jgi:hypothetical protein
MVLIHESPFFKYFYSKLTLWIYFITSNLFLLLPAISVLVEFFLFLCFQDDWEYNCILLSQETFVGYDQTIANGVGPASFESIYLSRISSFLIRSLLVWPHIQRNIHISAILILLMCYPFISQYSIPYIIAGLIVVLWNLSFSLLKTFLLKRIPDTYLHFIHLALILWLTSSLIPPSLCNIDLKYQNVSFILLVRPN